MLPDRRTDWEKELQFYGIRAPKTEEEGLAMLEFIEHGTKPRKKEQRIKALRDSQKKKLRKSEASAKRRKAPHHPDTPNA